MKAIYILILCLGIMNTAAFSSDTKSDDTLSQHEQELLMNCNLEARNSLIHGDLDLVERLCMQAANDIEKNHKDKKYMVNPLMNLGFSYSLAGHYEKATPLFYRARSICENSYGKGSEELKKVDDLIKRSEGMKMQSKK